jgi:Holliday junction resolvase
MKISPELYRRHLHDAAVEQLSSSLEEKGYTVRREVAPGAPDPAGVRFDLVATRDGETVVYEVKVAGGNAATPGWPLGRMAELAKAQGARFRLVVVRPERGTEIEVFGLEDALKSALQDDPTGQLGTAAEQLIVAEVDNIEVDRLRILPGGRTQVAGRAVAAMARPATDGKVGRIDAGFAFGFDVTLGSDGALSPDATPVLDLSGWAGDDPA